MHCIYANVKFSIIDQNLWNEAVGDAHYFYGIVHEISNEAHEKASILEHCQDSWLKKIDTFWNIMWRHFLRLDKSKVDLTWKANFLLHWQPDH